MKYESFHIRLPPVTAQRLRVLVARTGATNYAEVLRASLRAFERELDAIDQSGTNIRRALTAPPQNQG